MIQMMIDIANLGTFWQPMWKSGKVKTKKYLFFTDVLAKINFLLVHVYKLHQSGHAKKAYAIQVLFASFIGLSRKKFLTIFDFLFF